MPLVHVNGIEGIETGKNPILTDIASPQTGGMYKNFMRLTDGEFYLDLKASQYELLRESFPNHKDTKVWQKAEIMYRNAIFNGIHGTTGTTSFAGFLIPDLYEVQRDINVARKRMSPAGGDIDLKGRSNIGIGTDPIIDIPNIFEHCSDYAPVFNDYGEDITPYDTKINFLNCQTQFKESYKWEIALNEYLERSAHHLLYEFATDGQASQMRPTKNWKIGQHQQGISLISDVSKMSRANIVEWHRLGIMRHNALKGAGALPPLQTIELIFSDQNATIDNIIANYKDPETGKTVTIGLIPGVAYIIFACVAALVAIGGIIQIIKGKEPTAFDRLAGIGKVLFSAQGGDNIPFLGGGSNDDGKESENEGGGVQDPIDPPIDPPKEDFLNKYKTPLLVGGGALLAYNLLK